MAPVYDLRSKYYKLDMRGRSAYDHWSRDSMPFVDVEDDKGITFEEVFDKRINHTVHIYPELRALEWSRYKLQINTEYVEFCLILWQIFEDAPGLVRHVHLRR